MNIAQNTLVDYKQIPQGVHRILANPVMGLDYILNASGTVKKWNITDVGIMGISCFSPMSIDHGVPHSNMWKTNPICCLLNIMPQDFLLYHDFKIELRGRNGKTKMSAYHFLLFPTKDGITVTELESEVTNAFNALCQTRAAGQMKEIDLSKDTLDDDDDDDTQIFDPPTPWTENDLDGISDNNVVIFYRVAKKAYPIAPTTIKLVLNGIMTVIATTKPSVNDMANRNQAELRLWCGVIVECGDFMEIGALTYLSIVQNMLESIIKLDDSVSVSDVIMEEIDNNTSNTSMIDIDDSKCNVLTSDIYPLGMDKNAGFSSEIAIEYLRHIYFKHSYYPIQGLGMLLNKILFLVDFAYLMQYDNRLFEEIPQAWENGPCYAKARIHYNQLRNVSFDQEKYTIEDKVKNILEQLLVMHMKKTSKEIVEELHDTEIWKKIPKNCNHPIMMSDMISSSKDPVLLTLIGKPCK